MKPYSQMKYGLFVHYVYELARYSDGSAPESMDAFADGFHVEAFADSVQRMGVEYLILTAWHYRMRPLYPSAVTERWRPGNSCRRDLLGQIIDAMNDRGIAVILYTHPRDGHDLEEPERTATGWGEGYAHGREDTPHPDRFHYETWNRYVRELYTELAQRYGKKIIGFYTDGVGPTCGRSGRMEENRQIVDYLMIRDIMKKENPDIVMIQNYFGYLFSNDYAMPEGFFGYEDTMHYRNTEKWPACRKALAICPFDGGWWPAPEPRGADVRKMPVADMVRYTLFNASCTDGGGLCWASGPYCEGSLWPEGVSQTMEAAGRQIHRFRESVLDAVPCSAYPTHSGDTLEDKDFRFFTASKDGKFVFLHLLRSPGDSAITLPRTEDGSVLTSPVSLTQGVSVEAFAPCADGCTLTLAGEYDPVATVIRFCRSTPEPVWEIEWINNTDKRIRYEGNWKYRHLTGTDPLPHGCFEADFHTASHKGDSLFLAFEGSFAQVFCNLRPGNGAAQVFLDGVFVGRIETDGATAVRQLGFRSIDLHGAWHTLYLVLDDDKPFELDAVKITK